MFLKCAGRFLTLALFLCQTALPAERPNILWITSEDNAAHWLGCYGNKDASTPRLDTLAADGLRFTRAYSNAPVCAVARSTILNGAYAVTQGTQHMRSRPKIPASFRPYVSYLRESGYYCSNNAKTDYNFKGKDAAVWDACSGKAHYQDRPEGKPFMAVFNLTLTHESSLFPATVRKNRQDGIIPEKTRLDPATITLPPHQPDLPEFRSDTAIYHDCLSAMDRRVGELLDELKAKGLAEDTIVFYYSDHGGAMARGKRYLQDTGTRVPLIVHFPPKWQHLSPFKPGSEVPELVSFIDLAPTLLSLCGLETPSQMQGRAFLGSHRAPARPEVFLFGDRFDGTPGMRRAITDGRYKYIRCFTPDLPGAPYSSYALGQPSWKAWQKAWQEGKLGGDFKKIWEPGQPVELLFDTQSDPWETKDLAPLPEHAERLSAMRSRLRDLMVETRDTSVVPEPLWPELVKDGTIFDFVRTPGFDHRKLVDLAFEATTPAPQPSPAMIAATESTSPVERYWAETAKRLHKADP